MHDGFETTGHLQFAEDRGDMIAQGFGADHQLLCNRLVGIALSYEPQNLSFTLCQIRERLGGAGGRGTPKYCIRRWAMAGLKMASPVLTTWMACNMCLGV